MIQSLLNISIYNYECHLWYCQPQCEDCCTAVNLDMLLRSNNADLQLICALEWNGTSVKSPLIYPGIYIIFTPESLNGYEMTPPDMFCMR